MVGWLVTTGSIIHGAVSSGQPRSGHPYPLKFSTSSTSASASLKSASLASASFPCTLGHESCIEHCPIMYDPPTQAMDAPPGTTINSVCGPIVRVQSMRNQRHWMCSLYTLPSAASHRLDHIHSPGAEPSWLGGPRSSGEHVYKVQSSLLCVDCCPGLRYTMQVCRAQLPATWSQKCWASMHAPIRVQHLKCNQGVPGRNWQTWLFCKTECC